MDSITYQYLTFETLLPHPSQLLPTGADESRAPVPTDLAQYASPLTWSRVRKHTIIALSCLCSTVVCYAAGAYDAALESFTTQWDVTRTVVTLGITTFTVGFGIAPMILAPFSELNGRKPVFVVTGIIFFVAQLGCALTTSFPGLLVARLFVGIGGSSFSSTIGGVIGDIYARQERNTPMALFTGSALFGTGLGPLVSGFVAQRADWRWVFWVQVVTCGVSILLVILLFDETRGSVILSRKARALNTWYELREKAGLVDVGIPLDETGSVHGTLRIRWKVQSDELRTSLAQVLGISLYRPFQLLVTEPVVFLFSLWAAFSWAVLYLTFSIVPLVFTTNHHFNLEQNGAVFAAMCTGSLIATVIGCFQDNILAACYRRVPSTPEGRLYPSSVQSALLPIALFWFAGTLAPSVHWTLPTLAIGCATMGLFSIYLAVFNYLTDTYGPYASSALAAQSFCRNMFAGTFPLFAEAMFRRLTFAGASSLLGGISLLLTMVPWALIFYGPK
ncbi:MFS general substrate transporter [Aspergillus mulundensis]|uniref:MFS general substrate transporter n=1 Tax=Aspergillus mulundensis TaxID=1810919 RepID=A0A3D8T5I2_9EURO|nr:MFS general substrate transporter [Aspergillus mulundensis]RDW93826.1 MFS general substrate transporter [Aspergillus mulundensis]